MVWQRADVFRRSPWEFDTRTSSRATVGSATTLVWELRERGVASKRGRLIDKGFPYKLLNNDPCVSALIFDLSRSVLPGIVEPQPNLKNPLACASLSMIAAAKA